MACPVKDRSGICAGAFLELIIRNKSPLWELLPELFRHVRVTTEKQNALLYNICISNNHSALFYYRYSDRTPLEWNIAVDRDTSKSRFHLDYPFVQPYYMKKDLLKLGVTSADYGDCTMQIFDRDRLICDCIFNENKMDRETYNKAIQGYVADPKKNIPQLLEYAEKRRILKKVKDRIGVWL